MDEVTRHNIKVILRMFIKICDQDPDLIRKVMRYNMRRADNGTGRAVNWYKENAKHLISILEERHENHDHERS